MANPATTHFPSLTPEFQVTSALSSVRHAITGLEIVKRDPNPVTISQQIPEIIARIDAAKVRLVDVLDRNIPPEDFVRDVLAGVGA